MGIPKQQEGLFLALAFRGRNPKPPPLHLDGASQAEGVWVHSHGGLRPSEGRHEWCVLGCSKSLSYRLERVRHCLGRSVILEEFFIFLKGENNFHWKLIQTNG